MMRIVALALALSLVYTHFVFAGTAGVCNKGPSRVLGSGCLAAAAYVAVAPRNTWYYRWADFGLTGYLALLGETGEQSSQPEYLPIGQSLEFMAPLEHIPLKPVLYVLSSLHSSHPGSHWDQLIHQRFVDSLSAFFIVFVANADKKILDMLIQQTDSHIVWISESHVEEDSIYVFDRNRAPVNIQKALMSAPPSAEQASRIFALMSCASQTTIENISVPPSWSLVSSKSSITTGLQPYADAFEEIVADLAKISPPATKQPLLSASDLQGYLLLL